MELQIGKVFYFGCNQTPNTVTKVIPYEGNSQYVARIELQGPRGGKSTAFVGRDGRVIKS